MKDKGAFFTNVYEVVKLIPPGKITSYGAIAAYLGSKRSARVVGWALNNSSIAKNIPAHRVVNKTGHLTGKSHFGTMDRMQKLLEKEGIKIIDDQIQNMEEVFWNPQKELL